MNNPEQKISCQNICMPFVGDSIGGAQISALLLAQNLPPQYAVVIVVHQKGPLTDYLDKLGIPWSFLALPRLVGRGVSMLEHVRDLSATILPLKNFLRQNEIAALHCNDGRICTSWAVPSSLTGIPLVWHQRTLFAKSGIGNLALRLSDQVICNSKTVRNSLPRHTYDKTHVIDNPFVTSTDEIRNSCRIMLHEETGFPDDAIVVGFVGNLTNQKRPEIFLETCAKLQSSIEAPVAGILFGSDRDGRLQELKTLSSTLGITRLTRFMGFKSPVEPWLSGCDFLLAPAVGDGLGRAIIEAMLCGTPVVATSSAGHLEIVEDQTTGLLVTPDSPDDMAEAILFLLENPAFTQSMAKQARAVARQRFSMKGHVEGICDIYDLMLNKTGQKNHNFQMKSSRN
jgi:glycosyltransferase involved in cell wall biosynthesis